MNQIKKDIFSLLKTSIIAKPLALIKGFVVVKFLTPEMYGLLNIINNIQSLSKYGDFGFISVVERDYNYYNELDKIKAKSIKNVGYSAELILSVFLSFFIALVSFFYYDENFIIFFGILASSLLLLVAKVTKIYSTHFRITKQFQRFAKYSLYSSLVVNLSIAFTVPFIGIYSPLIIGVLSSSVMLYFMYRNINLDFRFSFNLSEVKRQFKVGLSLAGLTLIYGSSIFIERYMVVELFDLKSMGYIAFILFVISFIQYFIYDFVRPYMPRTKEEIAKNNYNIIYKNVFFPTMFLVPVSFIVIYCLNLIVPMLIENFLPHYINAIEYFVSATFSIYFIVLGAFSGYLLYSPGIDKVFYSYLSHLLYIVSFVGLSCFMVFYINIGLMGIIYSLVISSAVRVMISNIIILKFIFSYTKILLYTLFFYILPIIMYTLILFTSKGFS